MGFCLSHSTAAAFWCWASRIEADALDQRKREAAQLAEVGIWNIEPLPLPAKAASVILGGPHLRRCSALRPQISAKEVREFAGQHELALPLHITVSDQALRQKKGVTVGHVQAYSEESAPFYSVGENAFAVSPALALIQLARDLDLIDWLILAYEFCGTYTLDKSHPKGFRNRAPLTSAEQIAQAADQLPGLKGIKKVRRALKYLKDGSASPMETALAIALALPRRLNGLQLGAMELNVPIELGEKGRALYPRSACRCDFYYPSKKIALEYDSNAWHGTEEQRDSDALRRVALTAEGIEVVPVVFEQVRTYEGLVATGALLAKKLRQPVPAPADEEAARALVERLFGHHTHPWE